MELSERQIKEKKIVGSWNGIKVLNLLTKGGLNVIASAKDGIIKILGVGPWMSVAKHVATELFPDISWEESLAKNEDSIPNSKLVNKYVEITQRMQELDNE